MAAFDFPSSPAVGDIYTLNGVAYQWNGYAWGGGPIVNSDAFVMKRGDTMTGDLTIAPPAGDGPEIFLNKASVGSPARVWGQLNGVNRWRIAFADGTPESGGNAGSDFNVTRYDDSGALLDAPFAIGRANGLITANIAMPTVFAHRSAVCDQGASDAMAGSSPRSQNAAWKRAMATVSATASAAVAPTRMSP